MDLMIYLVDVKSFERLMFRICLVLAAAGCANAQEWPVYGGDAGGTRYSMLKQIHRGNVASLRIAWTYHTGDVSDGTEFQVKSAFENTPLVVDGVLYLVTPFDRLIALEPETGKELWAFDPKLDKTKPQMLFANRGAALWTDGRNACSTGRWTANSGPLIPLRARRLIPSAPAVSWTCAQV